MVGLARALHAAGHDVFCPVLPGHLQGREDVMRPGWRDWLKFSEDHFDALTKKYKNVSVGGVCVGGVLAMSIALTRKPKAVVSISPILKLNGWSMPWYRIFLHIGLYTPIKYFIVFPEGESAGIRDEKVREQAVEAMGKPGKALDCFPLLCVKEMLSLGRHLVKRIRQVQAPLLVIHSIRDDLAHISSAKLLFEGASSPDKKFVTVENSYHLIILDQDKEIAFAETVKFLAPGGAK
jgi:carboxylesterase